MKKSTYYAIGLLVVTLVFHVFVVIYIAVSDNRQPSYVFLDNTDVTVLEPFSGIETVSDSALLDSASVTFIVKVYMSERPDGRPYAKYPKDLVEFVRHGQVLGCRLSANGRKALIDGKRFKRNAGCEKSTDTLSVFIYADRHLESIKTDPKHEFVLSGVSIEKLSVNVIYSWFDIMLTDSCDIGTLSIDSRKPRKGGYLCGGRLYMNEGTQVGDLLLTVPEVRLSLEDKDCKVGTLYVYGSSTVSGLCPEDFGHIRLRPGKDGTQDVTLTVTGNGMDLK